MRGRGEYDRRDKSLITFRFTNTVPTKRPSAEAKDSCEDRLQDVRFVLEQEAEEADRE